MASRDSKCVFVANSVGEADVVVGFLHGEGIPAKVMGATALQGALGWVPFNEFRARGLEVWVLDERQAPLAVQLLDQKFQDSKLARDSLSGDPIEVSCAECGKSSTFDGSNRGTVQTCPHCGEFLDVAGTIGELESEAYEADTDQDE